MADGVNSRSKINQNSLEKRKQSSKIAQSLLGISSVKHLDFPDNMMDTIPLLNIVKEIEFVIGEIKPSIIYTHQANDLNIDHQITHSAVMTAIRPLPNSNIKEVYGFEVLSSTEWSSSKNLSLIQCYLLTLQNTYQKN